MQYILLGFVSFILLFHNCVPQGDEDERTVVAGDLGKIIGHKALTTSLPLRSFYTFHSIPYALPTGGTERFKPSKLRTGSLTENPDVAFSAYNPLNACPQGGIFDLEVGKIVTMDDGIDGETNLQKLLESGKWKWNMNPKAKKMNERAPIPGSEENENTCLVININTPKIPRTEEETNELLPVLFFIHGGSSSSAWGAPFNGFRLMSRDIVLVTFNYRLGVLGAFNLGTDDAPGNAMLYDSITALKWINRYIEYFGGDPNRVTVFGHSAGAMMASHLLLTPLSQGLMHGIIGASGSALAPWAMADNPSLHHHLRIAEYSGCYDPTFEIDKPLIIQCMQDVDVNVLVDAMNRFFGEDQSNAKLGFDPKIPSIQSEELTIEKVLIKSPYDILQNGEQNNVPIMMGALRHDGSGAVNDFYETFVKNHLDDEDFMRNKLFPAIFNFLKLKDKSRVFQHSVGMTYVGEALHTTTFWDKLAGFIDIASVFAFKAGAYTTVELHSKLNKSYYYAFEHQGFWSTYDISGENVIPGGIAHLDDMIYPFQAFPFLTNADIDVAHRYIDYIVNFATFGNPNGENPTEIVFPSFDQDAQSFLIINITDKIAHYARDTWAGNGDEIAALDKLPTIPIGIELP